MLQSNFNKNLLSKSNFGKKFCRSYNFGKFLLLKFNFDKIVCRSLTSARHIYITWNNLLIKWFTKGKTQFGMTVDFLSHHYFLRTLNYKHLKQRYKCPITTNICCHIFEMMSTDVSNTNDHRFQSHNNSIEFYMPRCMKRQIFQSYSKFSF